MEEVMPIRVHLLGVVSARDLPVDVIICISWGSEQKFREVYDFLQITEFYNQLNPEPQPHTGVHTQLPATKKKGGGEGGEKDDGVYMPKKRS
jgi:hypothetical protein